MNAFAVDKLTLSYFRMYSSEIRAKKSHFHFVEKAEQLTLHS